MIGFSFVPKNGEEKKFFKIYEALEKEGVTGIETIIGDHVPLESYEKYPIKGVHLLYYPTWLEFWKEEREKVREDFYNDEGVLNYYRSLKKIFYLKLLKSSLKMQKK